MNPWTVINKIFKEIGRDKINGIVHCSGGAQTKILHFVDNLHIIKDNLFDTPLVFKLIQSESNTNWREMYQVFNMGHRMEFYVPENIASEIVAISKSFDVFVVVRFQNLGASQCTCLSNFRQLTCVCPQSLAQAVSGRIVPQQ
mgnify:CR=1 FL=1